MDLPDSVHRVLLRWAGQTLGTMPAERVPTSLRQVARFTPGKRATMGAGPLTAALRNDIGFRAAVADHARLAGIDPESTGEPAERAAAAFLSGHPAADQLLDDVVESSELLRLRREVARQRVELAALRAAERVGADDPAVPVGAADSTDERDATADRLRRRLRDQGAALRLAKLAAEQAQEQASVELKALRINHDRVVAELRHARERLQAEQVRADRAQDQVQYLRSAHTAEREAADRRLDLLLTTVEEASQGLRREWQLASGGQDPAARVAAAMPSAAGGMTSTVDTANLAAWLTLPQAHLIVDGYNVTKSGYAQLTLADQRDRLIRELSLLAGRTSAEITVVFDGASVVVPQPRHRGVRVLYSPHGVLADDVITQLVAAEPVGRVLLVVTADNEILQEISRRGARPVTPTMLLTAFTHQGGQ